MSVSYKHVLSTLALSLAFTLAACAGTTDEETSSAADSDTVATVADSSVTDTQAAADAVVATADTAAPQDISAPDLCPGGPGCLCKENTDCD